MGHTDSADDSMSVRPASFSDIPRLVSLMVEMGERSRYAGTVSVVPERVKRLCAGSIRNHGKGTCLFVGERDGRVESMLVGAADWAFGIGDRYATSDPFFYASPSASPRDSVRLALAYEGWARSIGAFEARLTALDSLGPWERNERMYRARGFKQEGVLYRKEFG